MTLEVVPVTKATCNRCGHYLEAEEPAELLDRANSHSSWTGTTTALVDLSPVETVVTLWFCGFCTQQMFTFLDQPTDELWFGDENQAPGGGPIIPPPVEGGP